MKKNTFTKHNKIVQSTIIVDLKLQIISDYIDVIQLIRNNVIFQSLEWNSWSFINNDDNIDPYSFS